MTERPLQAVNARRNAGLCRASLRKPCVFLGGRVALLFLAGGLIPVCTPRDKVAAFDLEWQHSMDALLRALNAGLPADMR